MDDQAKIRNDNETRKHIAKVQDLIGRCVVELVYRQNEHDASKLESPERDIFAEWVPKLAAVRYGSVEYNEMLDKMRPALENHYALNRHHPEHFKLGMRGMNLLDLLEMVCDWVAAARRHDEGDPYRSVGLNQVRFGYTDELAQIFENTLDFLQIPRKQS